MERRTVCFTPPSDPNWTKTGTLLDAGNGWLLIEYDGGETQTIRPTSGNWEAARGHRAVVTQRGVGEWTTYRVEIATFGVAEQTSFITKETE